MTTNVNLYASSAIISLVEGLMSTRNNMLPATEGAIGKRSPACIETEWKGISDLVWKNSSPIC